MHTLMGTHTHTESVSPSVGADVWTAVACVYHSQLKEKLISHLLTQFGDGRQKLVRKILGGLYQLWFHFLIYADLNTHSSKRAFASACEVEEQLVLLISH